MDDETLQQALQAPYPGVTPLWSSCDNQESLQYEANGEFATDNNNNNSNNNNNNNINHTPFSSFMGSVVAHLSRAVSVASAADSMSTQALLMHCESMTHMVPSVENLGDFLTLSDNGLAAAAASNQDLNATLINNDRQVNNIVSHNGRPYLLGTMNYYQRPPTSTKPYCSGLSILLTLITLVLCTWFWTHGNSLSLLQQCNVLADSSTGNKVELLLQWHSNAMVGAFCWATLAIMANKWLLKSDGDRPGCQIPWVTVIQIVLWILALVSAGVSMVAIVYRAHILKDDDIDHEQEDGIFFSLHSVFGYVAVVWTTAGTFFIGFLYCAQRRCASVLPIVKLRTMSRWSGLIIYVTIALAMLLGIQETETIECSPSESLALSLANNDDATDDYNGGDKNDDANGADHQMPSCVQSQVSLGLLVFAMTICTAYTLVSGWVAATSGGIEGYADHRGDGNVPANQPRQVYRSSNVSEFSSVGGESDIESFFYDRLEEDNQNNVSGITDETDEEEIREEEDAFI